jgi:molybdenum cofactor cytidylyltransferase
MIAGVFLAAGLSRRFGSRKLLHEVARKPLIYYSLGNCLRSRVDSVFVVVGPSDPLASTIDSLFPEHEKLRIVCNPRPDRGQMSSLKVALTALPADCSGAMIILADMPFVNPSIGNALVKAFEESNNVTIPVCRGERLHPRIIPRSLFPDFQRLSDDARGRSVIDRQRDVTIVSFTDRSAFIDIDCAQDLDLESKAWECTVSK